jgi:RNA polymerase-interacting CarD/CdnL/TRCF family regulator
METQDPTLGIKKSDSESASAVAKTAGESREFQAGMSIIYGLHGKCTITGIESRSHDGKEIRFYKLEVQRSNLSRSSRREPAIWVPISTAKEKGLRLPLSKDEADDVMNVLSSREYYFPVNEPWSASQLKLETSVRLEGAIGLAKAASFLHVLKRRQVVPSSDLLRLQESVNKLLIRELSEALGEQPKVLEDKIAKLMRQKLNPDN